MRQYYPTHSGEWVGAKIGRSAPAVHRRAWRMGLVKRKAWSKQEVQFLQQLYPTTPNEQLEQILGHPVLSIIDKAHKLGIKKRS